LRYSQKLAALGRLLAGVAHEVKNPLNAMAIHLELMKQKLQGSGRRRAAVAGSSNPAPPEARAEPGTPLDVPSVLQHAGVIGDEIRRLDEVVQGFLKFSRPEEIALQPVSVKALVDEVTQVLGPEAAGRGVSVRNDCDPGLASVHADPAMLRQALLNLAINGCQAMPNGGSLRFSGRSMPGGFVEVTVQDSGVGIPPEHLAKIFDLYFTTKEGGSGIGLSMVYRTVQLHDGSVEVESTPGAGTTFRLVLPQAGRGEVAGASPVALREG
jgi:signal transduction histidine kinase